MRPDDTFRELLDSGDAQIVAAADGEREAVPFVPVVGLER